MDEPYASIWMKATKAVGRCGRAGRHRFVSCLAELPWKRIDRPFEGDLYGCFDWSREAAVAMSAEWADIG